MRTSSGEHGKDVPTLDDALRISVGTLATAPARTAAQPPPRFVGVEFHEPAVPAADYRDRIVLAAGVPSSALPALARELEAVGAAALVIRRGAWPATDGAHDDHDRRMPVLHHLDGDWAQLADLLRSLLSAHSSEHVTGVRLGDLFGLADALATLAGGAVSIVDSAGQVLGYSTHGEQPIDDMRRRTTLLLQEEVTFSSDLDYRAILQSSTARHFPSDNDRLGRVGIAVRAAGELLGSVWVIQVDLAEADRTRSLLEDMVPIAAQHLLRARDDAADRDRRNSALLRTLLEDERHAHTAASQLLIRPEAGCTIVCFRVDTFDEVEALRGIRRLLHLAISVSSAALPGAHCAIIGPQVVAAIPGSSPDRVKTFAQAVIRTDDALIAGIGTRADDVVGIARSHREAGATAGMLMSSPVADERHRRTRIATFADVRDRLAVLQVTDLIAGLDAAVGDAASIMAEHDAAQGTDLTRTLRTYLDHFGSVRETAAALHVHQNTVRYRLDTARNDLGVDLDSPDTRLWLWLRLAAAVRPPG